MHDCIRRMIYILHISHICHVYVRNSSTREFEGPFWWDRANQYIVESSKPVYIYTCMYTYDINIIHDLYVCHIYGRNSSTCEFEGPVWWDRAHQYIYIYMHVYIGYMCYTYIIYIIHILYILYIHHLNVVLYDVMSCYTIYTINV